MGRTRETSEARQRILETADRLFYQDGIRAVGIDRIIAEANVAKMSLYKHFPSKDDLILAVLQYREQGVLEFFRSAMERHGKKAKKARNGFFFLPCRSIAERKNSSTLSSRYWRTARIRSSLDGKWA